MRVNNIMKAMMADDPAERERYLNLESLRVAVSRAIFCELSKVVLDVRTAVMVTVTAPDGRKGLSVYDGKAYDKVADAFKASCERNSVTLEVIDGRTLR